MSQVTMQGHSAAVANSGGGAVWLEGFNGVLDTAFKAHQMYQHTKQQQDASGQSLYADKFVNPQDNGAAVVVDGSPATPGQQQSKAALDKAGELLGISGKALLVVIAVGGVAFWASR